MLAYDQLQKYQSMVSEYEKFFPRRLRKRLALIPTVYRQQKYMYDNRPSLKIKGTVIISIDYGGFPSYDPLGNFYAVISVYMTVYKIFGAIFVQKINKAPKSPMWERIEIVDMPGRSMGTEDVKAFMPPQLKPQLPDTPLHLSLRKHILSPPVTVGTAQAKNTQPFADYDSVFSADTSSGRIVYHPVIVVASDVHQRTVGHTDQKVQIFRIQVPTRKKFISLKAARLAAFSSLDNFTLHPRLPAAKRWDHKNMPR